MLAKCCRKGTVELFMKVSDAEIKLLRPSGILYVTHLPYNVLSVSRGQSLLDIRLL